MSLKAPLFFAAPVSWYMAVCRSPELILCDEPVFRDDGSRNRAAISSDKGIMHLTVPLRKESRRGPYGRVEIAYREPWQKHMVNTLRSNYGRSPFYEYYDYLLEPILLGEHVRLWDLNTSLLRFTLDALRLDVTTKRSEEDPGDEAVFFKGRTGRYYQTFASRTGFLEGLSILDLLFHEGPDAGALLFRHATEQGI